MPEAPEAIGAGDKESQTLGFDAVCGEIESESSERSEVQNLGE